MIVGIVGKPNVGKSAFFRALTLAHAESGNFPFTTINANSAIGYVKVKDPAIDFSKHSNPREGYVIGDFRFVPIEVIDVAGLVPGANEGKGLGNKFLDDLRQADVLIHVIDLSGATNEKGEVCPINSYDPANDVKFLEEEIDLWFFNIIKRNWDSISKKIRLQDMKMEVAFGMVLSGLKINENQILSAISTLNLNKTNIENNLFEFSKELRRITKPMIIAANKCDVLQENNLFKKKIEDLRYKFPKYTIIPVTAEYEWNLKQAQKAGLIEYIPGDSVFSIIDESKLKDIQIKGLAKIKEVLANMESTGVQESINSAVFDLLKMKPIFPGGVSKLEDSFGNVLPDCFLMDNSATALDFAYRLHTDFGKNFIKAINVRTKRMVGKEHVLDFGDIVEIVSGK